MSAAVLGYARKLHNKQYDDDEEENEGGSSVRVMQKKNRMKKEIREHAERQKAKKEANNAGGRSRRFTDEAEDLVGRGAEAVKEFTLDFIREHPREALMIGLILLVVLLLVAMVGGGSALVGGGDGMVLGSSYTANDEEITAVEEDYQEKERELQTTIDEMEQTHPGYDEYNYDLTEVSHNPFELASLLTILYEDYTEAEVQQMLQRIYEAQYTLTTNEVTEIRTRLEVRGRNVTHYRDEQRTTYVTVNGQRVPYTYTVSVPYDEYETYEETVQYEYKILNVKLENHGIRAIFTQLDLTEDQMERYSILMELQGNKPDVFGDNPYAIPAISEEYEHYAIPGEYLTNEQFARMMQEAEKYLGYPYVWGGAEPRTSFDCSGFVSYVINHCGNGWNVGRLTANGLKNATARVLPSDVQPGDLIFFQGTYDTNGASHVGIVVDPVNKVMIHCGNPIQYAGYDTTYWRAHFYCYGRIQ